MTMSMPTTNTSNTSTSPEIVAGGAMNFRETQGYETVKAPTIDTVDEAHAEDMLESDAVLTANETEIEVDIENQKAKDTQTADNLVTTGVTAIGVGATIGAAVGSVIPGIGTIIGGAIGARIGAIVCLGFVIASVVVRPAKEPENYVAAAGQASDAVATASESANTLSNQTTATADATLVETPAPTTTTPAPTV